MILCHFFILTVKTQFNINITIDLQVSYSARTIDSSYHYPQIHFIVNFSLVAIDLLSGTTWSFLVKNIIYFCFILEILLDIGTTPCTGNLRLQTSFKKWECQKLFSTAYPVPTPLNSLIVFAEPHVWISVWKKWTRPFNTGFPTFVKDWKIACGNFNQLSQWFC